MIEAIKGMSLQEICDYAVERIVEQGEQCMDMDRSCQYSNINGLHCAIGFITDPDYHHSYDNHNVWFDEILIKEGLAVEENVDRVKRVFLSLQSFHDNDRKSGRENSLSSLNHHGINTIGKNWQAWLNMGETK